MSSKILLLLLLLLLSVVLSLSDLDGLWWQSEQGARMGYTGKQVIHPNQVPVVRKAYTPSADCVEWAKELVAAFEQHQQGGLVGTASFLCFKSRFFPLFTCTYFIAYFGKFCFYVGVLVWSFAT